MQFTGMEHGICQADHQAQHYMFICPDEPVKNIKIKNTWNLAEQGAQLLMHLGGTTNQILQTLPPDQQMDYNMVRACILKSFGKKDYEQVSVLGPGPVGP